MMGCIILTLGMMLFLILSSPDVVMLWIGGLLMGAGTALSISEYVLEKNGVFEDGKK